MHLVVTHAERREPRFYGIPARGALSIGSAPSGDVQITGHNIASRHVVLLVGPRARVEVSLRSTYGVRLDGRPPRSKGELLVPGAVLEIDPWSFSLVDLDALPQAPAIEESFLETLERAPSDLDTPLVYADWLEEHGRTCEAEALRQRLAGVTPSALLLAGTLPAWRRRVLPMAIEGCDRLTREQDDEELDAPSCPRTWSRLAPVDGEPDVRRCAVCDKRVAFASDIATARERALQRRPVVIDPAVTRHPGDLLAPIKKEPAIDMGVPVVRRTSRA